MLIFLFVVKFSYFVICVTCSFTFEVKPRLVIVAIFFRFKCCVTCVLGWYLPTQLLIIRRKITKLHLSPISLHSASSVRFPSSLNNFWFFNCTPVSQTSDSMMVPT